MINTIEFQNKINPYNNINYLNQSIIQDIKYARIVADSQQNKVN